MSTIRKYAIYGIRVKIMKCSDLDIMHVQIIECDHPSAEAGFHAMLQHWVRRPSPPTSWSAVIRALKCLVINRADIAADMKKYQVCCTIVCIQYIALTISWMCRMCWKYLEMVNHPFPLRII